MTHALEFNENYYVLFEQPVTKYGGYGKRWLCIISNNKLEKIIDCPKNMETIYLDFYVQNGQIILKPYMDQHSYIFNIKNYKWKKNNETDDLIFADSDFYVYSLDFGEWGGKTWFKDKKTGIQYVTESTTPLVNKIGNSYFSSNSFQVLKIKNPKELKKCHPDVTYENIEKTGNSHSWYSESKGDEIIYGDTNVARFTGQRKKLGTGIKKEDFLKEKKSDAGLPFKPILNERTEAKSGKEKLSAAILVVVRLCSGRTNKPDL